MSNRLFQSIIHQLHDTVDRVIGVIDDTGLTIACSELSKIGEMRSAAKDEMAYTTKVVDEQDRAARSYEYAYSACLGTLEGTDRRRRYLVGIEAHERAVNVEE